MAVHPGLTPEPDFQGPFFCLLLLLLPEALPCLTVPSFHNCILTVTGTHVVKSFLHTVKNPHYPPRPGPQAVTRAWPDNPNYSPGSHWSAPFPKGWLLVCLAPLHSIW